MDNPNKSTNISYIVQAAETPITQNVYKTFQLKKVTNNTSKSSKTHNTSSNVSSGSKSEKANFGRKAFIGKYSNDLKKPLFGQAQAE